MPLSYFFFNIKAYIVHFYFYVKMHIIHTSLMGMWIPFYRYQQGVIQVGLDLIPYIGGDIYKMLGYPVG